MYELSTPQPAAILAMAGLLLGMYALGRLLAPRCPKLLGGLLTCLLVGAAVRLCIGGMG